MDCFQRLTPPSPSRTTRLFRANQPPRKQPNNTDYKKLPDGRPQFKHVLKEKSLFSTMLPGEVRLVRCPKCRNILPEFNSYVLYQCGVCGTILRAKSRNPKPGESEKQQEGATLSEENSHGETITTGGKIHSEDQESPRKDDNSNNTDIANLENEEETFEKEDEEEEEEESVMQKDCIYTSEHMTEPETPIAERENVSQSSGNVPTSQFHNEPSTIDDHLEKLRVAEEDVAKLSYFSDSVKGKTLRGKIKLKEEESCELVSKMDELINQLSQFSLNTREEYNQRYMTSLHSRPYTHSCNLTTDGSSPWKEGRRAMHSAPLRRSSAFFIPFNNGPKLKYEGQLTEDDYGRPLGIYCGRRHCRAVGGGAPFIVCSHCSELLQIPTRNWGRVRCGSCLKPIVVCGSGKIGVEVKEGKGKKWRRDLGSNGGFLRPPPGAPLQMHFDYSSNNLGGGGVGVREEGSLVGRIKRGIKDLHRFGGFY